MASPPRSLRLKCGSYLGEISALAFLPLPPNFSSFPLLLAGTGSQILTYDITLGTLLSSFHAFEGVRVHGISFCSSDNRESGEVVARIAVFGEKNVKLFLFDVSSEEGRAPAVRAELECSLPRFDHWVLDALFLKEDNVLAVGLSDNSIAAWDVAAHRLVLRVRSPDKCLLYSMRLWGDSIETMFVASGTIFNEIVISKLVDKDAITSQDKFSNRKHSVVGVQFLDQKYIVSQLYRLTGHEGSIFRISWSSDGSKLMSVSDDRSARVWTIHKKLQGFEETCDVIDAVSHLTLYGHDARIWDCHNSDTMYITVGEDCTCRIWSSDGQQLKMIKEHIGRGIWRCLYHPDLAVLVTAGFDSAIKLHQLSLTSGCHEPNVLFQDLKDTAEATPICFPNAAEKLGFMDSKSEYVRSLCFGQEDILYVATNNGFLYNVKLHVEGDAKWTQLEHVSPEEPIICMDLLALGSSHSTDIDDIIAIGDGKGYATVIGVVSRSCNPKVAVSFTWSAESERQLLGIYWSKSLGYRYLFTADPRGKLKLWHICDSLDFFNEDRKVEINPSLLSVFSSSFGARIVCLDSVSEVVVCGDLRGNLSVFSISSALLGSSFVKTDEVASHALFKGAHGVSSVTSVLLSATSTGQIEICTTGGDGCICYFKLNYIRTLEFIGMKQVKELSTIRSIVGNTKFGVGLTGNIYAVGFTSADFIIWNLTEERKIVQVPCGGWRRPYSIYFGDMPEFQNCFAFLKDHTIYIHRIWVPSPDRQLVSKVLHLQFHGREVHTLRFLSTELQDICMKRHLWLATGCEDGTVRLARCTYSNLDSWSSSKVLGEHVGGSAVRSLCFVTKTFISSMEQKELKDGRPFCPDSSSCSDCPTLLISVGAKQVLTAWILRGGSTPYESAITEAKTSNHHREDSISFDWLSSHTPQKHTTPFRSKNGVTKIAHNQAIGSSHIFMHGNDDWRYMAVTAFLVKNTDSRLTFCFIVVAGSDATLTVRALLLPHRLWFDVATLTPLTSPILSLQHIVISPQEYAEADCNKGNTYVVISGSTSGAMSFWDITSPVEKFMQSILKSNPEASIYTQRRPRTGRGSQGGRQWKSSGFVSRKDNAYVPSSGDQTSSATTSGRPSISENDGVTETLNTCVSENPCNVENNIAIPDDSGSVNPVHVFDSVHQSGVNCLHVSKINCEHSKSGFAYCALSGGDDQSLHSLIFHLEYDIAGSSHLKIRALHKYRVASAHSSAVKGVWTDGMWVFSTGLDQRLRCWMVSDCCKLTEYDHLVFSVPEPEALDVVSDGRNNYRIAVAGRGMQIVEFFA